MSELTKGYEELRGPLGRRIHRVRRMVTWNVKRALNRRAHILVETRWRLGDEIMAIPIYEGIKRAYPNCVLKVWSAYPELLAGNPFIDQLVLSERAALTIPCDRYILLRGAPRDIFRLEHYARRAGIPTPEANPRLYFDTWECASAIESCGHGSPFIAVCTGASWATKRWPAAHWRELCQTLEGEGHRVVQVGKDDEPAGAGVSLMNRTSLWQTACVLRAARLLICCDSGLMHLALAAGAPVLALFGPTTPSILIREGTSCACIANGRPCGGCWNVSQEMTEPGVCPRGIASCMESISVADVMARVRECLARAQ
ncbi:MAG: glycosyltransferase family 9 protein [Candidatus Hydrogenedentes bacterium]|nr:glycosyltransferase family 9 protein [Candidatus Hydrogenedentota bacterium]